MKLSTVLPILAVSANKRRRNKDGDRRAVGELIAPFVASNYPDQCSDQIPSLRNVFNPQPSFETTNDGTHGEIRLEHYPIDAHCRHVVQAVNNCKKIVVKYRSFSVERDTYAANLCGRDAFGFEWADANGSNVTPPMCDCYGDGCKSNLDFDEGDYSEEYFANYWGTSGKDVPDGFSIDTNTFTFYFSSDGNGGTYPGANPGGHVILDWQCVDTTTSTLTWTEAEIT